MKKALSVFLIIVMISGVALAATSIFAWYHENAASTAEIENITTIQKEVPVEFKVETGTKNADGTYETTNYTVMSPTVTDVSPKRGFYPIMPKKMKGFRYVDGNSWLVGARGSVVEVSHKFKVKDPNKVADTDPIKGLEIDTSKDAVVGGYDTGTTPGGRLYSQMTNVTLTGDGKTDRVFQPIINITNDSADGKTSTLSCALFASKTNGTTDIQLLGYTDYNFGYAAASGRSSLGTENLNPFVLKKGDTDVRLTLLTWIDAKKASTANIYSKDKVEVYLEDYTKQITDSTGTYNKYYTNGTCTVAEGATAATFNVSATETARDDDGNVTSGSMTRVPSYCIKDGKAYPVTGLTGEFGAVKKIVIPQSVETEITVALVGGAKSALEELVLNGSCSVADRAFQKWEELKKVFIGSEMKRLGQRSFDGCTQMSEVIMQGGTELGEYVFTGGIFTDISVPSTVVTWANNGNAFRDCNSLINVFADTSEVCAYMFKDCDNLQTIVFGPNVKTIKGSVTDYCTNLKSIIIGDNVTDLNPNGNSPFSNSKAVTNLIVGRSVTSSSISNTTFASMANLNNITMPADVIEKTMSGKTKVENVTITTGAIPANAFKGKTTINTVTIHGEVTSIGTDAFLDCSGLKRLNVLELDRWCGVTFEDAEANPLSQEGCELYVDGSNTPVEELVIPGGVTEISNYAFYNCDAITSLVVPNDVTSVGADTFTGCSNIKKVVAPSAVATEFNIDSLEDLEITNDATLVANAFNAATKLATVKIKGVTSIDNAAFTNCPIKTAEVPSGALGAMPASVENLTITSGTISGTNSKFTKLATLKIADGVTVKDAKITVAEGSTLAVIKDYLDVVEDKTKVKHLEIVDSIQGKNVEGTVKVGGEEQNVVEQTPVDATAINEFTNLESIKIGDYTTINGNIDCANLTKAIVPGSKVGGILYAAGGNKITNLEVTNGTLRQLSDGLVATGMSYWSAKNATLTIADGVIVEDGAFKGCTAEIATATVPANVINPMLNFNNHYTLSRGTLTKITVTSGNIPNNAFKEATNLTEVYVNDDVTGVGSTIFSDNTKITSMHSNGGIYYLGDEDDKNPYYAAIAPVDADSITEVKLNDGTILKDGKIVKVNDGCKIVAEYAFARLGSLTTVTIPDETKVTDNAFYGSYGITSVTAPASALGAIPRQYTNVDGEEWSGNRTLTTVTITSGSVTREIFNNFEALTNVTIKEDVRTVNGYAFNNCIALTTVTFENGGHQNLSIGRYAFNGCTKLNSVSFGTPITWRNGDDIWQTTADAAANATLIKDTYLGKTWRKDGA